MSHTAIIILNYNGEKLLRQFLPSVIQHSDNAEIIVADNNSSDQSVVLLQQSFPLVRIISLDKNYGFCGGYNRALKLVVADYYVLLNSDVEVTANWLAPMVTLLDNNQNIAAVQPKVLSFNNKNKFEHAGAGGGFIDCLGYPFCRGRILNSIEEDSGQYNDEVEVFWATGACLMIRSEAYNQFNGFDEDFFAHMEEIDLCWKLHRAGKKIYYTGKSAVYHLGAGTLGYQQPGKTYLNFRNGLSLIYKHFLPTELLYKLPLRILLDWIAAFHFLLKGEPKNFSAVVRAHYRFLTELNKNTRKRKELLQTYSAYPDTLIYPGLIIIDYYLKGRKKVSGLKFRV